MSKLDTTTRLLMQQLTPNTIGEQINVNHTSCPAGADTKHRLYIKRTADALLGYCHNCGGHAVLKLNKHKSLSLIKEELHHKNIHTTARSVDVPKDTTTDITKWPEHAQAWWYGYELSSHQADINGVGWSDSYGRLIIPYYDYDDVCVFWQGRDTEGKSDCKWLMATSAHKPLGLYTTIAPIRTLVIVEDPISAIKIAAYIDTASMCLYGTSISDEQVAWFTSDAASQLEHVVIWLDPDIAGQIATPNVYARLRSVLPVPISIGNARILATSILSQPKDTPFTALAPIIKGIHGH